MKRFIYIIISCLLFSSLAITHIAIAQEDVSSVKINSIQVDASSGFNHLKLLIKGRKPGYFEAVLDTRKATQKTLEYFFIGLAINEDRFWVDLNPYQADRVIDQSLENTDLGRIMLNADLRLKEDVTTLINPQVSKTGKEFWRRLFEKAQELGVTEIPVMTRVCIVPAETIAYETENQFSIIKSSLRVILKDSGYRDKIKDDRLLELDDFSYNLMQELILPELDKRVNEAYTYADLREVYNALILAQWYKGKFSYSTDPLLRAVNSNVINEAELNYSYSTEEIYQDYLKSFKGGEYSFSENDSFANPFNATVSVRHYFSGGVDFRRIGVVKKSSISEGVDKDSVLFVCDLLMPKGLDHPLQYAKSQVELTSGGSFKDRSPTLLVKNLPAISPVRFTEANMQHLNSIDRTERILLSKL